MAVGGLRQRTVVRLRALLSAGRSGAPRARGNAGPVVRRLLAVGGLAAVGWLFGHTGQAHADTIPGPIAAPHMAAGGQGLGIEHPVRRAAAMAATVSGATPASPAHLAGRGTGGGAANGATQAGDAVRALFALPAATRPAHGVPTRTPAPRTVTGKAAGGHPALGRTQGVSWVRRPMTAVPPAGAPLDRAVKKAPADPRPAPGLPRPDNRQADALAGGRAMAEWPGTPTGGHLLGAARAERPRGLAPLLDAVPPAVHTAADEPSSAPD